MPKVPVATNEHLDHGNPHTFEIEDLKRLIKKTTADLEIADKQRKQEFKVRRFLLPTLVVLTCMRRENHVEDISKYT